MLVISLYDESANMVRPWAEAGHECIVFDIVNDNCVEYFSSGGSITYACGFFPNAEIENFIVSLAPNFLFGFPPCTDLAVSGAASFAAKSLNNPLFQHKAMELVYVVPRIANLVGCPYFFENPKSVISSMYKPPDFKFNPYEYGGYLPCDDTHPRFPEYINARDAYPKETWIWYGNGFIVPDKKPVPIDTLEKYSKQHRMLGGKSNKTKQIRSETPRGWARAVFEANT